MATQNNPSPAPAATNAPDPNISIEAPPVDGIVEADDNDSTYGASNSASDWTSVTSSIYSGVIENGRRYQSLKEGEYWGPSDEQQFESMANTHLYLQLFDQREENIYFRSPIGEQATHILDIGTGTGEWAIDVADKFPNVIVHGVDLSPPPETWVPPNCILEVDDVTKPWLWSQPFDLIHIRYMLGSFTDAQWARIYREAYRNLKPGGWLEHVETSVQMSSDDGSVLPHCPNMAAWGDLFTACAERMGCKIDTINTMRGAMERAGFVNFQEKNYKVPFGPKHPLMKAIGRVHLHEALVGLEGYSLHLLTRYGSPRPWSPAQVEILLMQMRQELKSDAHHAYSHVKRVWCQKPVDAE